MTGASGLPAALAAALAPVLRDLTGTGWVLPRIEDTRWTDHPDQMSAMLWGQEGWGLGIWAMADESAAEQIASLADQVQEWAVEDLWGRGRPATWPECPEHPGSHPVEATVRAGRAVWACPRSGTVVAEVGALS